MEENEKDTTETGEDSPGAADIDYRGLAEALIFVSKEPLSVEKLAEVVPEKSKSEIKRIVRELRDRYSAPERGIIIEEVAGGFRMMSARWAAPWSFPIVTSPTGSSRTRLLT